MLSKQKLISSLPEFSNDELEEITAALLLNLKLRGLPVPNSDSSHSTASTNSKNRSQDSATCGRYWELVRSYAKEHGSSFPAYNTITTSAPKLKKRVINAHISYQTLETWVLTSADSEKIRKGALRGKLVLLLCRLAHARLQEKGIPFSPTSLANMLGHSKALLDSAFPGYSPSMLLVFVVPAAGRKRSDVLGGKLVPKRAALASRVEC